MRIGYVIIGIVIAVLIFIGVPGLFDKLVTSVQWIIHFITSLIGG